MDIRIVCVCGEYKDRVHCHYNCVDVHLSDTWCPVRPVPTARSTQNTAQPTVTLAGVQALMEIIKRCWTVQRAAAALLIH